ncbi:MAG: LOG family protein [Acidimicrobiia bacterium]|nr:MAG: LOG family protein [Acidimicrobiia bacterium]
MTGPLIAVFGSSQALPGDGLYEEAVRCGDLLARSGFGVVTGGYGGVMEAAARGARLRGARAIGVTVPSVFPDRPGANEFVSDEMPTTHLMERIHALTDLTEAWIAMPGSLGTLAELAIAWNLAFVARYSATPPKPLVTVGEVWAALVDHLAGSVGADRSLVITARDVDEAVAAVVRLIPGRAHPGTTAAPGRS